MKNIDMVPHLLLGDFDSIEKDVYDYYKKKNVKIITEKIEKDYTDTHLAIDIAINKGCKKIYMFGCTGSRLDHTLSNIFLLRYILSRNVLGCIIDGNNDIYLIDREIKLKKEKDYKISLLAITDKVNGICTEGLYYKLSGSTISMGESIGVSNEFIDEECKIKIDSGLLLVLKSKD